MSKRLISSLPCLIFFGATMPIFAGQAHPSGPENRPFSERTIAIQGMTRNCTLTFGHPKPDDIVDWTSNGRYEAFRPHATMLDLIYEYRGHFWQGVFGSVVLSMRTQVRKPDSPPWTDLQSLLEGVRIQRIAHNQATKANHPDGRQEWLEPVISKLNDIPCIQQYVFRGNNPKGEWLYYFPIDENYVFELSLWFVDNSNRPGLTKSDWHPRAEVFANQLLSTVRIRVDAVPPHP